MQDLETEDQQIEALKKWWQENGRSLITGVIVGVAAIFGWREYSDYTHGQAQLASDLYNVVAVQTQVGRFTDQNKYEQLKGELKETPYAAMAAMAVARYYFDNGETDQAISELDWARSNAATEEVRHLASIRLASVYLSTGALDAASGLLAGAYPDAFMMRYEELKGDVYAAQGKRELARQAYDKALSADGATANPLLELKRRSLGS